MKTADQNNRCDEGGQAHTWNPSRPLEINDHGVLCNVRACLRCDVQQEKPYGARRGAWKPHRPAPIT